VNMLSEFYSPILGGLLIGVSAVILLLFAGRIAGISGIFWRAISEPKQAFWPVAFIVGLPLGTALFHFVSATPIPAVNPALGHAVMGGLLVGLGVKLGSGCTSGHGVCGIGRLSIRSFVATGIFMTTGIITVWVMRHVL
jgi:uncharacterized protein